MRALHRVRESLVQDKVKTTNQMHAFLLEFGISVPRGAAVISRLSTILEDNSLPLYLSQLLLKLQQHYHYLVEQIKDLESQLKRKLDEDEVGQRLLSIPCVGTLTASTISTEIGDGKQYASSRDFAAATGLVPRSTAREVGRHCWELRARLRKPCGKPPTPTPDRTPTNTSDAGDGNASTGRGQATLIGMRASRKQAQNLEP
jgi:transposase